jgi:hypothetical protein
VQCDTVIDFVVPTDENIQYPLDVPIIVLDVSNPLSHSAISPNGVSTIGSKSMSSPPNIILNSTDPVSWMNYDTDRNTFPLHASDDAEAIYHICQVSGGSFWDQ